MNNRRELIIMVCCLVCSMLWGQTSFTEPTTLFVMHSSGNHLERGSDGGGYIESPTKSSPQQLTLTPVGQGYYSIQVAGKQQFLSLTGQWNSTFAANASADEALWAIEAASGKFVKLRCKANNKYLGTDSNDGHQKVYTNKEGNDVKHLWYFSDNVRQTPPGRWCASGSTAGACRCAGGQASVASGRTRRLTRLLRGWSVPRA